LHIAHPGFFLSPAQKSVPGPAGVQNSGLRNEILHHPSIISEISFGTFAEARKKPGNFSRRFTDNKVFSQMLVT
jgi:hypothetical protein